MSTIVNDAVTRLQDGQSLTESNMADAMSDIMDGKVDDDTLSAFLLALADKGENVAEITGAARVLREKVSGVKAPVNALDCCGTGGDSSGTYNISTAVAIVLAACGVPIAKHGNRAASSKSGAADVLEAMGVNLNMAQADLEYALKEFNFAFLMAPNHHPSMKNVASVRKSLGKRTIFNLLGPLANPAGTRYQLLGVYDKAWLVPIAETLKKLGTKRAWVVHGSDGMDEITLTGKTHIAIMDAEEDEIATKTLTPKDFGLEKCTMADLKGGDAEKNAKALRAILEGEISPYRDIVLANVAAGLVIHGSAADLKEGVAKAAEAIDSGFAWENFCDYIAFTRSKVDEAIEDQGFVRGE
ncbi:MAG: anthranilate phosphoribosyltransferase [Alphaproteobacteria bacterium]